MSFTKVTASNGSEYTPESVFTENGEVLGVIGQDKTPGLSVTEMQESIEAVVRKVAIPAHNALVEELSAETAAENLGAKDKNGNPSGVQDRINAAVENDGTMPFVRLNADRVIETSTDGVEFEATGSSGHIIEDKDGVIMPQRSRLRFEGGTVEDRDGVTVVTAMQGEVGPEGPIGPEGPQGATGPAGSVMVPAVNEMGYISWELQETATPPAPAYIRGPQGPQGVAGPTGPQGMRGPSGIQGIAGPQGVMGKQGATGPAGPTGPQGPAGATGATGPQGPAGKDGLSLYVEDVYPTLSALRSAFPTGNTSMYMVEEDMNCYIWSEQTSAWVSVGKLQGPEGPKGETGATGPQGPAGETGPQGPQGIQGQAGEQGAIGPEGPQGPAGRSGTISIGSVTTTAAGTTAQVTNSGTAEDAIFNFSIPKGDKGDTGEVDYTLLNAYLPLAGGKMTGPIDANSSQEALILASKGGYIKGYNAKGSKVTVFGSYPNYVEVGRSDGSLHFLGTKSARPTYNGSEMPLLSDVPSKKKTATISVGTSWSGSGPYTQTVTVSGATASSKVDLQPDAAILQGMMDLGVTALFVTNNNGVFTLTALGAAPNVAFSLQATIEEVTA